MRLSEKVFKQAGSQLFALKENALAEKILLEINGLNQKLRLAGSDVVIYASHEKGRHILKIQKDSVTEPVMWSGQISEEKPHILITFSQSRNNVEVRSNAMWFSGQCKFDYTYGSNFNYEDDERLSDRLAERILGLLEEHELKVLYDSRRPFLERELAP